MPRIAPSNTGRTPMERLIGHAPRILHPWATGRFCATRTGTHWKLRMARNSGSRSNAQPKPSIEWTSNGLCLSAAAHVKR